MNNWDKYYYDLCQTVASNSKCLSRKIGAIIVKDKSIIATGYNGPPRNVPSCDQRYKRDFDLNTTLVNRNIFEINTTLCPRQVLGYKSGEGLEFCVAGHAERNALINSARHGIKIKDAKLYCNCPIPCKDCLIEIINAGISEIIVTKLTYYDKVSEYLTHYSGIKIREFDLEESV